MLKLGNTLKTSHAQTATALHESYAALNESNMTYQTSLASYMLMHYYTVYSVTKLE